jgi:uncharacterized protein YdeI (YjbR/CyaY-like superfamily)
VTKNSPPILAFASAARWRTWLAKNHALSDGIWLRFYRKSSATKSVTYNEAVDEALCYGWIDGQGKSYDEESHLQRFTPRRARSVWSKLNTERIERLTSSGKMRAAGLREVAAAKKDGRWERAYAPPSSAEMPPDFLERLARNKKAQAFFQTLNKRNTYPIVYRLQNAKKPETREKRINDIVAMLARGEKFYP